MNQKRFWQSSLDAHNTNLQQSDLDNINVTAFESMPSPGEIQRQLPLPQAAIKTVYNGRCRLRNILEHRDPRLFIVVGPCSIHDPVAGLDYAKRLKKLADEVADAFEIVMRVYFEKPRTTVGWKGYTNDPFMNDTFKINIGMHRAREFLIQVADLGLPAGTEALDPFASQTHREISSGLSTPVGFKNATSGDLSVAVNAILSASRPHAFLGINEEGRVSIVRTKGNPLAHMVLRGGDGRPNYDTVSVALAEEALKKAGITPNLVVDCSHANSHKKPEQQPLVMQDVMHQVVAGNTAIVGLMLESNIEAGNQKIPEDLSKLKYGCSVTDACIDWSTTERIILQAADSIRPVLEKRL